MPGLATALGRVINVERKMELKTAAGVKTREVIKADIIEAFQDDECRGEFVILSRADQVYIQAAGEGFGPYTLEYRDGDADRHFQCTRELSKAEVQSAFLDYFNGGQSWQTDFDWTPLQFEQRENKPWWKFW
jgi:hypothetical protein